MKRKNLKIQKEIARQKVRSQRAAIRHSKKETGKNEE